MERTPETPIEIAARSSATITILPLWGVDGMRDARDLANALDAGWHAPAPSPTPDPWSQQTAEIRRRLAELASQLDFAGAAAK